MTILEVIRPIITRTYGESEHSQALSERLAGQVAAWSSRDDEDGPLVDGERERMLTDICWGWDWMTGGTTALDVAAQIESALLEAGY